MSFTFLLKKKYYYYNLKANTFLSIAKLTKLFFYKTPVLTFYNSSHCNLNAQT